VSRRQREILLVVLALGLLLLIVALRVKASAGDL
jgi:hypothetical protein